MPLAYNGSGVPVPTHPTFSPHEDDMHDDIAESGYMVAGMTHSQSYASAA